MSFRVDKKLKKQADALFKSLGLNTSVALNMFLAQCVHEQGIPFTPKVITKTKNSIVEDENLVNNNIEDLL